MTLIKQSASHYILYSLSCLVIITASITFILSLYRLQRDASLLNRERKRDYVTNKINKSFPTIAIIISIIVCLSSILAFIAVLLDGRTEMLIISIVSNIILGIGLIVLAVIMLGFVQNIVDNFSIDIERLLVDFILHNKTSARDELLKIENSNDCCTTQDSTWTKQYSQAAECNRDDKYRLLYADQDEQRGCVKIITRAALTLVPILISEITSGCLCLLLGLWTIYVTCHMTDQYDHNNETRPMQPETKYPYYPANKTIQNRVANIPINDEYQMNKLTDNHMVTRYSHPTIPLNRTDKSLYVNTYEKSNFE
ncbi:unnamed protein product [Adineta ricciae]|uniref:Uncharacterized protein n=1 Tax=Adineta ricciae TaxID=249248 RepID=A0A814IIB3_ADIRI|nr:unnamed protein product [Adineta ricciae]CAF1322960.1 unnamed protein product [Adineta ricciae]